MRAHGKMAWIPSGWQCSMVRRGVMCTYWKEHPFVLKAPAGQIGLLALQPNGSLSVIGATASVLAETGVPVAWTVVLSARYIAADVNGDGRTELLAFELIASSHIDPYMG